MNITDPRFDKEILWKIRQEKDNKIRAGQKTHAHRYGCPEGYDEYVKMYRWTELNHVIQLRTEPFETIEEAEHFKDCFNDNFLEDAYVDDDLRVYTGWIEKACYTSYLSRNREYYEFVNWS